MSSHLLRRVLLSALALGLFRLSVGLGLMLYAQHNPEAHMLALLDVPTLLVYLCSTLIGLPAELTDAGDLGFLLVGILVWTLVGGLGGIVWVHRKKTT